MLTWGNIETVRTAEGLQVLGKNHALKLMLSKSPTPPNFLSVALAYYQAIKDALRAFALGARGNL